MLTRPLRQVPRMILAKPAAASHWSDMISAIVLAPDVLVGEDTVRLAEIVVRSLAWLVSAVVAGVVRDVTLAAPAGLGLGEIADQAGCALVQGDTEGERLSAAVAAAKGPLLLIVLSGFVPQGGLIEEIEDLARHSEEARAVVCVTPASLTGRLFPDRTRRVGLIARREVCRVPSARGFGALVRAAAPTRVLRSRATPIG